MMKTMATYHVSTVEAARDFEDLLARVRSGAEVIIEDGPVAVAILRSPEMPRRSITESIALAKKHAQELGYEPTMDPDFAADLEEIIRNRKPRDTSRWD